MKEKKSTFGSPFSKSKKLSGATVAVKMRKDSSMKAYAKKVYKRKSISEKELEKMLPDYVSGGDIRAIFKNA